MSRYTEPNTDAMLAAAVSRHMDAEAEPTCCADCGREFDQKHRERYCARCFCYVCNKLTCDCVGYCGIDGHTDEHLTEDLTCNLCDEARAARIDRIMKPLENWQQRMRGLVEIERRIVANRGGAS